MIFDFMGLVIDGNVVHGIARGGQAFLTMQANKDGSINLGGNLYTKQDPIVGKKIYITEGATIHYLSGLSINAEVDTPDIVLAVLKEDSGTYYFFNTYEGINESCTYAYVRSEDTRMANS